MIKYRVTLTKEERDDLMDITKKGVHRSQKVVNALILLGCDKGEAQDGPQTNEKLSDVLKVSMRKMDRVKKRFVEEGLDIALNGRKGERVYAKKADGDLEGYSKEYLNHPVAEGATYFRKEDFIPMDAPDYELHRSGRMIYVAAADFAISEKEKADNTAILVAGIDEEGIIYIVDLRLGKIGALDIIDELISRLF